MTGEAQPMTRLSWGVKQSFRGYVEGAGGVIETGAGATRTDDGGFAFPAAPATRMLPFASIATLEAMSIRFDGSRSKAIVAPFRS